MTDRPTDSMRSDCRLVMIDGHSKRILTSASAAGPLLPHAEIRPNARVAQSLTEAIEQKCGFSTIQLAFLDQAQNRSSWAVHEIIGIRRTVPASFSFKALDEIASGEIADSERALVRRITNGEATELGRFARLGWVDDLLSKLGRSRDRSSRPIIRQLNQDKHFCLLSIADRAGRKVWFKSVGEPNTSEYALTIELARHFPAYLPKILAAIPEWNGWVMEDVPRLPSSASGFRQEYQEALIALADLQKATAAMTHWLYGAGAADWSCARMELLSEQFFADAELAMQAQVSTRTRPLTHTQLDRLRRDLEKALAALRDSGIPDTLLHGDIGRGNLILSPSGPIFLDWAQAAVGHPFICAEHLVVGTERMPTISGDDRSSLRRAYASQWRDYGMASVEKALAFAPAVAAFAYALILWCGERGQQDSRRIWPLLRSLLRRSREELQLVSEVKA